MATHAKYQTSYLETEAILAASEKDGGHLLHLALNMTLSERRDMLEAARFLERNLEIFLDTKRFPEHNP